MPPTCRKTDINNHNGVHVSNVIGNVIVEGQPCSVIGTKLTPDALCVPLNGAHCGPVVVAGSSNVIAGGSPVTRIGDANDCGAVNASGATTVITGG